MKKPRTIIVKVGTKVIAAKDKRLDTDRMRDIVNQVADVEDAGDKVIVVTSGAIGAGMGLLELKKRPTAIAELQATAAIGQSHLMGLYAALFKERGYHVGQILLTQDDFNDRTRYLNIRETIQMLMRHRVVPIINENDTVSTDEIKCGDNDRLASLVGDVCQAQLLILLTDVAGLLDESGAVIPVVAAVNQRLMKLIRSSKCDLGTGGMMTKLEAAKRAVAAGMACVIANGREKDVIVRIARGESVGTTFQRGEVTVIAKKRWIAFSSKAKGTLVIDAGAQEALTHKHKSLLASGIIGVEGAFAAGDVVRITGADGTEYGRGITNYTSSELVRIKGSKTAAIKNILGYKREDEVIHKDNLVIM